jgi:hypothetical protein
MRRIIATILCLVLITAGIFQTAEVLGQEENNTNGISVEAQADQSVTEEDLEAKTPSAFHFLTRWRRAALIAFTQDPLKRAELRLESAHEELLRLKQIAEQNPENEKAIIRIENALLKFEQNIEKVTELAEKIKERRSDRAEKFLEKIADFQIKQQKVLDNLEEKLPPELFSRIQESRQKTIQSHAETMARIAQNREQLAEAFNKATENQKGSEFREFKNIEILEKILESSPEQSKEAISKAIESAKQRFELQMENMGEETIQNRFQIYVKNMNGNPYFHLKALDALGQNLEEGIIEELEEAKKRATENLENKIKKFEKAGKINHLLSPMKEGTIENLRVMQELKKNASMETIEKIEEKETEALAKFRERFADNPDAKNRIEYLEQVSEKIKENADQTAIDVIQTIQNAMPSENKIFLQNLKEEATQEMLQKAREIKTQRMQGR